MEFRHIKYFVAAADELNISRAALRLNISQPAVSRLVRELECELGVQLFHRERFGLSLTAEGKLFLEHARNIAAACDEAVKAVKKAPDVPGKLDISFITSALGSFLGDALKKFRERYPETEIRVHDMPPGDQITALRNRQVDLAFVGNPCQKLDTEFDVKVLKEIRLEAALPIAHGLSGRTVIGLKELNRDIFIGLDEGKFPGRNGTIGTACESAGFTPQIRHEAGSLVEVLGMVGAGMGVCLMPSDVANLPHPNVVFIPLADDTIAPIRLVVAWLPGNKNAAIQYLLECLET